MTTMTRIAPQATTKQLDFIAKLMEEKELTDVETETLRGLLVDEQFTKAHASRSIDNLLRRPRKKVAAKPELEAGMYLLDGRVYKVQRAVHGSGHLYAKELLQNSDDTWSFCYQPGAIGRLRDHHKMSLEQAKEFGALYGTCCVCGRTLTDERSIADGIGPVCGDRI